MNRQNERQGTMHTRLNVSGFALLALLAWPGRQEPTGRYVMERHEAQDRTRDLTAEQTMTLVSRRGRERRRSLTFVTQTDPDGQRKTLVRFTAPGDIAGTGFLSIEHADRATDKWLYLPALRRSRRIAGSDETDRFVGTDFTFEDLDAEDLDVYAYTLRGSEAVNGVETWVVEAIATDPKKQENSGYSRRELWISKDRYVMLRARYYDRDGALVKEFTAADIRQVPGSDRWRPYRMTMEDVARGSRTVLNVSEYVIDQGVPDRYFTERYLQRGR